MKVRDQLAAKLGTQTWHDIAPHCHGNFIRRGEITANLQAKFAEAQYCMNTPSKLLRWRSKPNQAE